MKIIVDIPKWPQFSETSVWRCEQQPGEVTGTGRWSTKNSGAGSYLLVCGPELGNVQHVSTTVTAHPLPSIGLALFCVRYSYGKCTGRLQNEKICESSFVISFSNPCPWEQSKASLFRHLTVLLAPGQDWVKLILAPRHLKLKDQVIKMNLLYM